MNIEPLGESKIVTAFKGEQCKGGWGKNTFYMTKHSIEKLRFLTRGKEVVSHSIVRCRVVMVAVNKAEAKGPENRSTDTNVNHIFEKNIDLKM